MKNKIFIGVDLLILGIATIEGIIGNTGLAIAGVAIYLMPTSINRYISNNA